MINNFFIECPGKDHSILCLIKHPATCNSGDLELYKNGCRGDACMATKNTATILRSIIIGEQLMLQ